MFSGCILFEPELNSRPISPVPIVKYVALVPTTPTVEPSFLKVIMFPSDDLLLNRAGLSFSVVAYTLPAGLTLNPA